MVEIQQQSDGVIAITVGEKRLESGNVERFREAIEEACPARPGPVVVDLTAVEMIDSSGIGALLAVYKRQAETGGRVILRGVQPAVVSVIELLRLHRVFDLELAKPAGAG
ncbi:STAS domain-containing protein [soil metagenome]